MANPIFRAHATNLIRHAINKARSADHVDHLGLRGNIREIAADELFSPFLPSDFRIGTGKITDAQGSFSSQTDLIIYNPRLLPPVLHQQQGRDGIFPVEACFYSVEVKSRATAAEIKDVVEKARRLRQLDYKTGMYAQNGTAIPTRTLRVVPVLFSFESDLSGGGKTELDRYKDHDPDWNLDPLISAFCIPGVGYWHFIGQTRRWRYWKNTPDHDEVMGFIAGIANSLSQILDSRLNPRIGPYLIGQDDSEWVT